MSFALFCYFTFTTPRLNAINESFKLVVLAGNKEDYFTRAVDFCDFFLLITTRKICVL